MRPPHPIADATADPNAERNYQYDRMECHASGQPYSLSEEEIKARDGASYTPYPAPPPAAVDAARASTEARRATVQAIRQQTEASIPTCNKGEPPTYTAHSPTPIIHPPAHPALAVECPQCEAIAGIGCSNYKGQQCAPHSARKARIAKTERIARVDQERMAKANATPTPTTQAPTPPPAPAPAGKADARPLTKAEQVLKDVDALLDRYTSGEIIEAAWEASAQRFRANLKRDAEIAERKRCGNND